jgi:glyoxylase-like metal-dependent hydrolase (beta-lactamase superfamily II)
MPGSSTQLEARRLRRTTSLALLVLCAAPLAGSGWYLARKGFVPFGAAKPRLVHSAVAVASGVYLLGGLSPSAAYVVETPEGLVLIDSGLDGDAARLKSQMAELGLDWRRIRAILLTHAHGDHSGGAQALRGATGAKVYAGEGDALVLRAGQPREAFFSTFHMPGRQTHPTTVDVSLKGGETITLGDARIQAISTPGHTPGSVCYLLERGNLRALFAGDVIMMLRGDEKPRTELGKPLGTYSAYLAPRYRGDANDSLASLRRLRAMPVPDMVLPGHPGADVTPQSPSLSRERWESLLDSGIHDMETLVGRYKADGADFLDGTPKQLLPGFYYLGDFQGAAVYGFFTASQFFIVDAPGGPGLVEFLSSCLRRLGREPVAPTAVLLTSCGSDETAGLKELVERWHPLVVASPEGIESIKESCPSGTVIAPTSELPGKGWFTVKPIPLQGRGVAPQGYLLEWAGKTVLLSGRIPLQINQVGAERLISDLTNGRGDMRAYFDSIMELARFKPDLWLPAIPTDGQNANLYDSDWDRTIGDHLLVIKLILINSRRSSSFPPGPGRSSLESLTHGGVR